MGPGASVQPPRGEPQRPALLPLRRGGALAASVVLGDRDSGGGSARPRHRRGLSLESWGAFGFRRNSTGLPQILSSQATGPPQILSSQASPRLDEQAREVAAAPPSLRERGPARPAPTLADSSLARGRCGRKGTGLRASGAGVNGSKTDSIRPPSWSSRAAPQPGERRPPAPAPAAARTVAAARAAAATATATSRGRSTSPQTLRVVRFAAGRLHSARRARRRQLTWSVRAPCAGVRSASAALSPILASADGSDRQLAYGAGEEPLEPSVLAREAHAPPASHARARSSADTRGRAARGGKGRGAGGGRGGRGGVLRGAPPHRGAAPRRRAPLVCPRAPRLSAPRI